MDTFLTEIFELMLSSTFTCGYTFEFCDIVYYIQDTTEQFELKKLKDKPEAVADNMFVNDLYQSSNLLTNPPTFNILFFSDFQVDPNYEAGTSSIYCNEPSCCHSSEPSVNEIDGAP